MKTPWLIHEAELALHPAWKDGLPFRGPGLPRANPAPVFHCKAALSISSTQRKGAATGHGWTGNEVNVDEEWQITVGFPDGVFADEISRIQSRLSAGGFHILTARFLDKKTREWSCFRWFYVAADGDDVSESGQVMNRSIRLKATYQQETVGSVDLPSMAPVVFGEVQWVCGTQRITCLHYLPDDEAWVSLPRNDVGDGTRYVNFSPVTGEPENVALSAYFPRVVPGDQVAPALSRAQVEWQNQVIARIGNEDSTYHHGLALIGHTLQALGIVEPLLTQPQERMLDEPVIVFRYLLRVYAVFGHGVLAVPRMVENAAPDFSHDYPFRLAIPGDPNPETGQSGLTLLPNGAWLDGTCIP